jgi:hypothetical protein
VNKGITTLIHATGEVVCQYNPVVISWCEVHDWIAPSHACEVEPGKCQRTLRYVGPKVILPGAEPDSVGEADPGR